MVRTFKDEVREKVCASIYRIIEAECQAGRAEEKPRIEKTISSLGTVNMGTLEIVWLVWSRRV